MKKVIVYYFSKTGSNRYLAEKIASRLGADIEQIRPNATAMFCLIIQMGMGLKELKHRPEDYDRVILCGPIWMGSLIYPLRRFLEKYITRIKELVFVTCCASGIEMKDDQYGYEKVFQKVKSITDNKCIRCEAFPITLVMSREDRRNSDKVMKTRLSDENFTGRIVEQLDQFITIMTEN